MLHQKREKRRIIMYVCTVLFNAPPLNPTHLWMAVSGRVDIWDLPQSHSGCLHQEVIDRDLILTTGHFIIALRILDGIEDTQTHEQTYVHLINCHLIHCFTNICGVGHTPCHTIPTRTESASFTDGKCGHKDIHFTLYKWYINKETNIKETN